MYAFRRSASRFLTSRSVSFASSPRTYTSFVAPSQRIAQRSPAFQPQRRWATTESGKEGAAPGSQLQSTGAEEVENATRSGAADQAHSSSEVSVDVDSAAATESIKSAPAVAESANLTEATEEALPAAETNESFLGQDKPTSDQPLNFGADGFQKKPTIYVGNLFFDVTESDLVKEFTRFGTVTRCKIIRDSRGLSKGFAYVDFTTTDAAEDAMQTMNLQLYEGRRMTVQFAARTMPDSQVRGDAVPKNPMNPPSKTLFIGNMSFEMTDRDLSNLFRGIRNVIDVRVAIDRRTGQPRGFAHADFIDVKSAMEALTVLKDKETYGRRLRVDYSYSSSQAPRNQPGSHGRPQPAGADSDPRE